MRLCHWFAYTLPGVVLVAMASTLLGLIWWDLETSILVNGAFLAVNLGLIYFQRKNRIR